MAKKYEKIHPGIKYGLTQRSRIEALESAVPKADQKYTIKLKAGQSLTLDVKSIEIDKLKYRIKNNRTRSAQNIWVEKNEEKIIEYIKEYSLIDYKPRVNYDKRTNWLREQDPERIRNRSKHMSENKHREKSEHQPKTIHNLAENTPKATSYS